jgi:hypothetical protein
MALTGIQLRGSGDPRGESVTRRYLVQGSNPATEDDVALYQAWALNNANTPANIGTALRQRPNVTRLKAAVYEVEVPYEPVASTPNDPIPPGTSTPRLTRYASKLNSKTIQATANADTTIYISSAATAAPDFKGAVNVDSDGRVQGVDILHPTFEWSEQFTYTKSALPADWLTRIRAGTGKVNSSTFRGAAAGEVLCLGVDATDDGSTIEIVKSFAYSQNRTSVDAGNSITVTTLGGWDYVWLYAESTEAGGFVQSRPTAAYKHRVYQTYDLNLLDFAP